MVWIPELDKINAEVGSEGIDPTTGRFLRVNQVNDDFLNVIGSHQAYFLGLMASDGWVKFPNHAAIAQSHASGKALLDQVARLIGFTGRLYYRSKADSYALHFTSSALVSRMSSFGIVPNKTLTLRFPDYIPSEHLSAFMRGYIDGDGCVGVYTQKRLHTDTVSLLISFVATPEFMLGCLPLLPVRGGVRAKTPNLSEFRVYGKKAIPLGEWLWSDDNLPKHYKQGIYEHFMREHYPNRKYARKHHGLDAKSE